MARPGRMADHRRGRQQSARRLRQGDGVAFGGRHLASQCWDFRRRSSGRRDGQFGLSARPVARGFPGGCCLAHHSRQIRDRAAAHRGRQLPRGMLAFLLGLCLYFAVGSGERRGELILAAIGVRNHSRSASFPRFERLSVWQDAQSLKILL
ncbi:hypothetical protein MPLA_140257 [Mesorhizobium sp. ORS 3359]|nr:hypothetical protein MPLA_140257 [Mesorhizobium sp. ORS 3359]